VRERLMNPFLAHRLADIAQNHAQKKSRRIGALIDLAQGHVPALRQPILEGVLAVR